MATRQRNLRNLLINLAQDSVNERHIIGKVTSVKALEHVCDVESDGLVLNDVRLYLSEEPNMINVPKKGSMVMVTDIGESNFLNCFVSFIDTVDFIIVKDERSIYNQFNKLLDMLKVAKLTAPGGVATFSPVDVESFNAIKEDVEKLYPKYE